ncbi:protein SENSITIVITY TO RED LIGHT REDUCED 1-like [Elaeis guineensis]|uniref:protein SENSITIVITY TO RED LIGHT REDUCED 1-like n=1 Tax=Elaeis guineensis var. tenera TaxID=51953 RepID=UPI003C6CD4FC
MQWFGCTIVRVNESSGRIADKPTLFYMPYGYSFLIGNLFKENWEPEQLDKSGALFNEVEDISNWKEGNACYVWAIRDHITVCPFIAFPVLDTEPFGKYRWMFFNIDSELELESLLSDFAIKLEKHNIFHSSEQDCERSLTNHPT